MRGRLWEWIAEVLFPPFCVSCRATGCWWCESCRQSVERLSVDVCPGCMSAVHPESCVDEALLDGVAAVGFYHDPPLRQVIWSLKYRGGTCVLPEIAQLVQEWRTARRAPWPWAGAASLSIVPLPSAPSRVRERGFDQAVLLSRVFQEEILPWAQISPVLERGADTPAQATVPVGPLRAANIRSAFRLTGDVPTQIVLIDDVATTGATLREAARLLKAAGAVRVYAVVLAVGK